MDDLTGKWARLSLNTQESQMVPLAPTIEDNARVLVAKLFTKRRVTSRRYQEPLEACGALSKSSKS